MQALPASVLSHSQEDYPEFDLVPIGVGTDGHVGECVDANEV